MPKELENRLRNEGIRKGLKGDELSSYIYGTMYKLGWRPSKPKSRIYKKGR